MRPPQNRVTVKTSNTSSLAMEQRVRNWRQQARTRKLNNVRFLPLLENDLFGHMLAATDIALITQQQIVSNIVFPSKTVTLLSAGCPVIASVNSGSEVARVVLRSGAGLVVEPENADALLDAIHELANNRERLARMSLQARQFAIESWDERCTLPRMEQEFVDCAKRWRDHSPMHCDTEFGDY